MQGFMGVRGTGASIIGPMVDAKSLSTLDLVVY